MKTEPRVFSFDDLKSSPRSTTHWDGVRNYQARNYMRDEMKMHDLVLFYHSNCKDPGVVGIAKIARQAYPDHTAWDKRSPYFDPKSSPGNPRWLMVDVRLKKQLNRPVLLKDIRINPKLKGMKLLQKGQRLSIQPVSKEEFDAIYDMGMR